MFVACHFREKIALHPDAVVQPLTTPCATETAPPAARDGTNQLLSVEALSPAMREGILDTLSKKFVGITIDKAGPVLFINKLTNVSTLYIFAGSSASWCYVDFLATVFRPSVGVLLNGIVVHQHTGGIQVDTGFYDNIHIPAESLPTGSAFVGASQQWVIANAQEGQAHIRPFGALSVCVTGVHFTPITGSETQSPTNPTVVTEDEQKVTMRVVGVMLPHVI